MLEPIDFPQLSKQDPDSDPKFRIQQIITDLSLTGFGSTALPGIEPDPSPSHRLHIHLPLALRLGDHNENRFVLLLSPTPTGWAVRQEQRPDPSPDAENASSWAFYRGPRTVDPIRDNDTLTGWAKVVAGKKVLVVQSALFQRFCN